ncbi:MAG: type II toxin-antitoxin system RelE/ParE family toxin [Gammaproteobacteria bacterium]|nr:type II toxin-antitoxin system RelE/ParE family toxin [Gammaproteobacteria bacterium]MBU1654994.1 type II toxin-antitoxin system RelE/ParE family toxin [Gammaproteobacteria bacterium]MBU1960015.1 type II toxin-antitoxin system RelE/ParE family toxin [Gammaproteobacteria bacterium]
MSNKTFRVKWTGIARSDLGGIIRFIAMEDPNQAKRILHRLRDKANTLASFPERGRSVPEIRSVGVHTHREVISNPWRIIYRIEGAKVIVLAVLDGRRDLEDLLLERLVRWR